MFRTKYTKNSMGSSKDRKAKVLVVHSMADSNVLFVHSGVMVYVRRGTRTKTMTGDMLTPRSKGTPSLKANDRGRQVRYDIEGLRAIAVLSVLIDHAFPKALTGGFAGVDIFFVISGYLIGRHLLQDIQAGRLSILGFYAKRARRIFPALALVLVCTWCAGRAFFTDREFAALARQMLASVFFSNNFLLWSESGYFDTTALDKPLLHLWSLGIEEQFYLLVPAMLWLGTRGTAGTTRWVARLGALSLLSTIVLSDFDYVGSFYLLHTRFWELAAGVLLAQAELRTGIQPASKCNAREILLFCAATVFFSVLALGASRPLGDWNTVVSDGGLALTIILAAGTAWLTERSSRGHEWRSLISRTTQHGNAAATPGSIAGLVLIGISAAALTPANWPGAQTTLPVLGAALLIAAGPAAQSNRFLALKPLAFVGGISYPLYLWHWPVIVIFRFLYPDAGAAELMIPLAVSFALAWLTKIFVEDPVRFGRSRDLAFRRPPLWFVVSTLAVPAILGLLVIAGNDVPSRFPPNLQAVAHWSEDNLDAWRMTRCYLDANSTIDFSSECTPIKRPGVPLVLLWGDSHAAHLYSGMAAVQSTMTMDIAQWTMAGCPPTANPLKVENPNCAARNLGALVKLVKLKPDTIVLAGAWERYLEVGQSQAELIGKLSETVHRLKSLGIRQIVIFGPGPLWRTSLPADLFRYMVRMRSNRIPERLGKVSDAIWNLDSAMAALAAAEQVQYVSVVNFFCDKTGCLTVGDKTSSRPDLLFRDRDHLSVSGSNLLMAHAKSQLFGEN
jgi:peptidoglycan/LPS O-acetylase OafA/YrhL